MSEPVLTVGDLEVDFSTELGTVNAVKGVSLSILAGETVGVVGESGSGKSALALAIVNLLPEPTGRIAAGKIQLSGRELTALGESEMTRIRGKDVGFIFQDPMVSLNPVLTVGRQVDEATLVHAGPSDPHPRGRSVELLAAVGLPDPEEIYERYPHELSGGMRQRVLIAMAIANHPSLVIADEPTTALDVTVQAQVLETLKRIQQRTGTSLILISHDLGLVADIADRVLVMYDGRIVEEGPTERVLNRPKHPYTLGLLASAPSIAMRGRQLPVIPGSPPRALDPVGGCSFRPRCGLSADRPECLHRPELLEVDGPTHKAACHFYEEVQSWNPGMTNE